MVITTFIQNSLAIIWVVLVLAAIILVLGWALGRLLSWLLLRMLRKTRIIEVLSRWSKKPDTSPVELWIRRLIRWVVLLLSAWGAWSILYSHPDIRTFLDNVWTYIDNVFQLPLVVFLYDLVLITLITILLFKSFGWVKTGFASLSRRIEAERGNRVKGIKIQKLELLSAKKVTDFLLGVSKYSRYLVDFILILIFLTGVFSIFPQTRGFVINLLNSLLKVISRGWISFVDYLPSLINLVSILLVTYFSLKLINFLFQEIGKKTISISGFHPEWAKPTYQLVRVAIIALSLIIAFPYLPGSTTPAFQGVSIFLGVLVSLGSTSLVGNIVAGIVLIYTRAFRVGDRVQIANTIGDVIDKGLLVTRIQTIKNVEVTIPNSMVLASHIINYSLQAQDRGLILNTTVTIGYDTPWRLMHEALIKAALATPDILPEPRPFVLQTSLDDFYVSYEINAYTMQPQKMANIYSDLHQSIQDQCNEAGIEIMSPHYDALRDGNASTLPAGHLPKDYQVPSFKVDLAEDGQTTKPKIK